jgi:hypothetical protein
LRIAALPLALLVGLLVGPTAAGCQGPQPARYPEAILREYQARFDAVRAALANVAPRLPTDPAPAQPSCTRPVDPVPVYRGYDSVTDYDAGNVEAMMAQDLAVQLPRRFTLDEYVVRPGFLTRGLQVTSARGPLGTGEFAVDDGFGRETDLTGALDKSRRLRLFLDAGLRMRYVLALRVVSFTRITVEAFPPELGPAAIASGNVTVDAIVVDPQTGDVPCRFTAGAGPLGSVPFSARTGIDYDTMYREMQDTLVRTMSGIVADLP